MSDIFATNAPSPPHWTLNSCFGEFRSVWVHLGSFRYFAKLCAIWAELVQLVKKVRATRSCRHFCNKRTWSSPLDPKFMFWWVSYCLGAFGTVSLLCETRCNLGWTGVINQKCSCHDVVWDIFPTNAPGPAHWTINSFFGEFRSVWVHLGSFRYCTKLGAIWAEQVQLVKKVRATRSWDFFATNAPSPPHCTLNSCFG